jgi:hypothetical protein
MRTDRLARIIAKLNQIHLRRRLTGRPTAHLYSRCRSLSQAYLDSLR